MKEPNMKVQINIKSKLNAKKIKEQKDTYYSINIDLVNNTDSIARFWIMSCSWQDNWIFNRNTVFFYIQGCDKNYPTIKQIEPGQKLTYNGIIQCKNNAKLNKETDIRLGFVLIKEHDVLKISDFKDVLINKIKKQKDIIWSEPFKIGK